MKHIYVLCFAAMISVCFGQDFYQEFNPASQVFRFEQEFDITPVAGAGTLTHENTNRYPYKINAFTFYVGDSSAAMYTTTVYNIDVSVTRQFSGDVVETNAMNQVETNNYAVVTNLLTVMRTNMLYSIVTNIPSIIVDDLDAWYFTTGDKLYVEYNASNRTTTAKFKIQATE
ncbi:MAG: hypothetical protein EOM12_03340 [Verrucomicrobiae bacterium]|nr:hypothetical protein [Verrucomicrobiae bacterium]